MNRAEAAAWSKLSIEDLKILGRHRLVKWNKELKYFASGGDVESLAFDGWKVNHNPEFHINGFYRIALSEIEILGVKVRCNPPETESLEDREKYYYPDASQKQGFDHYYWNGLIGDYNLLKRGMVFKDKEDVIKISKAKGWYE